MDASTSVELLPLEPQISTFVDTFQSALLIKPFCLAYGGLCLTTTSVSSPSDLSRLETFICSIVPEGSTVHCEIPSSRSFCKLMDVSFLRGGKPITSKDAEIILRSTVYTLLDPVPPHAQPPGASSLLSSPYNLITSTLPASKLTLKTLLAWNYTEQ